MKCLNPPVYTETQKASWLHMLNGARLLLAISQFIWENNGPLSTLCKLMIVIYLLVYTFQAGVKAKKATETYKSYVEKYATAKSEFEQKMTETAQVLL